MQGTGKDGIIALVLFTGIQSKIVLNQGHYKYKTSKTEIKMNYIFVGQIAQIFLLSSFFAVASNIFMKDNEGHLYMYEDIGDVGRYSFLTFLMFWFILMRYIPFDVIFQTETGKILYSKFMEWDIEMMHYDPDTKEYVGCQVQSMQLPE